MRIAHQELLGARGSLLHSNYLCLFAQPGGVVAKDFQELMLSHVSQFGRWHLRLLENRCLSWKQPTHHLHVRALSWFVIGLRSYFQAQNWSTLRCAATGKDNFAAQILFAMQGILTEIRSVELWRALLAEAWVPLCGEIPATVPHFHPQRWCPCWGRGHDTDTLHALHPWWRERSTKLRWMWGVF